MRRLILPALAAGVLILMTALPTAAHDVQRIRGTVDCQGSYSIAVTGDIYGGVHLIVKLGGAVIYDAAQNGSSAVQTFGPFTGSGATVGESIFAKSGDESDANGASGTLTLNGDEACPTPTPSPTPSPTPTPTPTPSPTPTATPSPSATPTVTPGPTITPPATDTGSPTDFPDGSAWLILLGAVVIAGVVAVAVVRDTRS